MIIHGDSIAVLKTLEENSIDAVVTDPPYGLKFMGKKWDCDVPSVASWAECLRVLKPGGRLLSFGGTRTYHRMACNVEDAGFEIRDQLQWIYGTGFPKSKTSLKPAHEPILLARKPGPSNPLNIDDNRIGSPHAYIPRLNSNKNMNDDNWSKIGKPQTKVTAKGRWPTNIILDEEAAAMLDEQSGFSSEKARTITAQPNDSIGTFKTKLRQTKVHADSGGASRFFYCAKASKKERNAGLEGMPEQATWTETRKSNSNDIMTMKRVNPKTGELEDRKDITRSANYHPTVKPIKLMEYLCRLITPPGGTILDPFCGSGSTGVAAKRLGFKFIGIEREEAYVEIARKRIEATTEHEEVKDTDQIEMSV